jgi:hypothetical protein
MIVRGAYLSLLNMPLNRLQGLQSVSGQDDPDALSSELEAF